MMSHSRSHPISKPKTNKSNINNYPITGQSGGFKHRFWGLSTVEIDSTHTVHEQSSTYLLIVPNPAVLNEIFLKSGSG